MPECIFASVAAFIVGFIVGFIGGVFTERGRQ